MDGSQTKGFTAGILGQSLGGIGGNGGSGSSVVGVGGNAQGGGSAGTVDIENTGIITATGLATRGILAQSVGGLAAPLAPAVVWSVGAAAEQAAVTASSSRWKTAKPSQRQATAPSVYWPRASAAAARCGLRLGGSLRGGHGFRGGQRRYRHGHKHGAAQTFGADALGLAAQSIGGGGGSGGISTGLVALGGSGNSSGNGGIVTVINDGQITTTGHSSDSIFAQSLGGGGGILEGAGSINVDFFGSHVGAVAAPAAAAAQSQSTTAAICKRPVTMPAASSPRVSAAGADVVAGLSRVLLLPLSKNLPFLPVKPTSLPRPLACLTGSTGWFSQRGWR